MKRTENIGRRVGVGVAVAAAFMISCTLHAQTHPGKAEVKDVQGSAYYSVAGGPFKPLNRGTVLNSGAVVKTDANSSADLFLGTSSGSVRLLENTTLGLDKLALTDTGADIVVDDQLDLRSGSIAFIVNKLASASKFEIKTPNGVAGIKGTRGRISSNGFIVLLDGTLVFVYVKPDGTPTPYTLTAPPPVYFTPVEGVKPAPEDLVQEVLGQIPGRLPTEGVLPILETIPPFPEPFVSPTLPPR